MKIRCPVQRTALILPLLACLLLAASAACAQPVKADVSETEKAIFAFYRLSGTEPDFHMIGRSYDDFMNVPTEFKDEVLEQTVLRLKTGFGLFDPKNDVLRLKTNIVVQLQEGRDDKPPSLIFHFPGSHKESYVPYFPYPLGDMSWIALIVEDLPQFSKMPLGPKEYEILKQYIPADGQYYQTKLSLRIRPKSADASQPMALDGIEQWLLLGDIAHIACFYTDSASGKEIKLWEYSAPWYLSESERELLPLLTGN